MQRTGGAALTTFLKSRGVLDSQIQVTAEGESHAIGPNPNAERDRAVSLLVVPRRKRTVRTHFTKSITRATRRLEPYQFIAPERYQFQLVVRTFIPYASIEPIPLFVEGVGDNRGFSMSAHVTYRTAMFLVFDLSTGRLTEPIIGHTTGSRRNTSDSKVYADVQAEIRDWHGDTGLIILYAHMEGSDPLVPLVAPNVDTSIFFTASLKEGNLFVDGRVNGDAFPSTEVFLRDNQRAGYKLLYYATPYGGSRGALLHLPGSAETRTLASFKEGIMLDQKARFAGSVPWRDWRSHNWRSVDGANSLPSFEAVEPRR